MFGKCVRSLIGQMGIIAIIFTVLTLSLPDKIQIRHWYFMICITASCHLFEFFTFQLKLFSSRIWVRRTIVLSFFVLVILVMDFLFGYFRFEFDFLITFGILILINIVLVTFAYYVCDKIEQQNLKLINQKLAKKNKDNID